MKVKISLILPVLLLFVFLDVSAQSIDIAATMTTGNAGFYKNVPGIHIGYTYDLKKQFIFIEANMSRKSNNDYAEYSRYLTSEESYLIQLKNGSFSTAGINLGIAQKIVASEWFNFSAGVKGGLNYYQLENDVQYLNFHAGQNGTYSTETEKEIRKNKPGIGILLDMELKRVIINKLSLFSRIDLYHSGYSNKHVVLDDIVKTHTITSFGFKMGLKLKI